MNMADQQPLGLIPPEVVPELSERQRVCLRFMVEFAMLRRQYPTYQEIATHMGVSRTQVGRYLTYLEKKHFIDRVGAEHKRNFRVTELGMRRLALDEVKPLSQRLLFELGAGNDAGKSRTTK